MENANFHNWTATRHHLRQRFVNGTVGMTISRSANVFALLLIGAAWISPVTNAILFQNCLDGGTR